MTSLEVRLAGLTLPNPVLAASGAFGFGREFARYYPPSVPGAIMVKGLTLAPRAGNDSPRIAETPAGMLNSIGLQNPGVDAFLREELPWLKSQGARVIANINGHSIAEFGEIARRLEGADGLSALEVNISCPNVSGGGMFFGTDPRLAAQVTEAVREHCALPLIVKLSPNVADIVAIARAVAGAGADILSLINTVLGMAIDIKTRRPILARQVGGLSGPAIKPIALRMVWETAQAVNLPIIAMGGIVSPADAAEFFLAGAAAVAVGAGNFIDPHCVPKIISGLERWLAQEGYSSISEIRGLALP
ncbi:MAG: dihydroorotate dehydrogenase [Peptococcaceae bacterium]|nr:dihydroorotate dehydrogenase [Peptococcaceae bacterium]